jgi:cytochrome c
MLNLLEVNSVKTVGRLAPSILAILALASATTASAAPSARGRLLFLKCASCHDISQTLSPKIGPNLYGVFGRRAGSLPGYSYSTAMKGQTFDWNEETLDRWLKKPSALVPGTAMAFAGIDEKSDREALIAYLRNPTH